MTGSGAPTLREVWQRSLWGRAWASTVRNVGPRPRLTMDDAGRCGHCQRPVPAGVGTRSNKAPRGVYCSPEHEQRAWEMFAGW